MCLSLPNTPNFSTAFPYHLTFPFSQVWKSLNVFPQHKRKASSGPDDIQAPFCLHVLSKPLKSWTPLDWNSARWRLGNHTGYPCRSITPPADNRLTNPDKGGDKMVSMDILWRSLVSVCIFLLGNHGLPELDGCTHFTTCWPISGCMPLPPGCDRAWSFSLLCPTHFDFFAFGSGLP